MKAKITLKTPTEGFDTENGFSINFSVGTVLETERFSRIGSGFYQVFVEFQKREFLLIVASTEIVIVG